MVMGALVSYTKLKFDDNEGPKTNPLELSNELYDY